MVEGCTRGHDYGRFGAADIEETIVGGSGRDEGHEVGVDEREKPARHTGSPREVDGMCSRCGDTWPCLRCLTSTPPFVPVHNNF